jgi:hypothetical protein
VTEGEDFDTGIDCAPGGRRPDLYLFLFLKGTGLKRSEFEEPTKLLGVWLWKLLKDDERIAAFLNARAFFDERLQALCRSEEIRGAHLQPPASRLRLLWRWLPRGVASFAFAKPENGVQPAVFDLAWPKGLQGEPSRPVTALLYEVMPPAAEACRPRPPAWSRNLPRPVVEAPGGTLAPSPARFRGCPAKAGRLQA